MKCTVATVELMDGVLVIDKPSGLTSHDVVNRVRRLSGLQKVGHLGTLDPMATGVLPLVVGRATRLAQFFGRNEKIYEGTVRFGFATTTYDAEGEPTGEPIDVNVSAEAIESLLPYFRGAIAQMPPPVSAKKVGGVPAYKLARQNKPVQLERVQVEIYNIRLTGVRGSEAELYVHCSSGTYMRSIAHDLGNMLGTGAHLSRLRRMLSGQFGIEQAHTLDRLKELAAEGSLVQALIPAAEMLPEFPNEVVDATTENFIRQGRDFRVSPFGSSTASRYVKAISESGKLVAIGEARLPHVYHPVLVL